MTAESSSDGLPPDESPPRESPARADPTPEIYTDDEPRPGWPGPEEAAHRSVGRVLRLSGLFYGAIGGTGIGWMAWHLGSFPAARHAIVGGNPLRSIVTGMTIGCGIVLFSEILSRISSTARKIEEEFRSILGPLQTIDCLLLATLSAFGEELFFRGGLQGFLTDYLSPWAAIAVTACLFGAMHIPMRTILLGWTAFAIAMGFLLGWLVPATGSILAPIAVHAVVNSGNLWRMTRRTSRIGRETPTTPAQ